MRTVMMLLLLASPLGCKKTEPGQAEPAAAKSATDTAAPTPTARPGAGPSPGTTAPDPKERCAKQCGVMRASFESGNTPSMHWYIKDCDALCTGDKAPRSEAEAEMVTCWATKPAELSPLMDCEPAGE